ncbi:hypothetical protein F0Q45_11760 [Mycobacterium simiae]|uniref:Uncharacterized protein n=1 Tax=Mycobacterium simiae TaxID=1784 RepID=A0A5B1BPR2_MYCSI|nr:hypothetical protein [Mycobacterium simiae]KAA1250062.1 hypothetical protein F0Q45_11760 [Mycobacterium simiae]
MALTFALMVSPAKSQVPAEVSADQPSLAAQRPVRKTALALAPTKKVGARKAVPTKKITTARKVAKAQPSGVRKAEPLHSQGLASQHIPTTAQAWAEQIAAVTESPTHQRPAARFAPYGPGSARADTDGSGPEGWLIKGRTDTRLYYTPDDPSYDATDAQVWFQDEAAAARAFFTAWSKSARRK